MAKRIKSEKLDESDNQSMAPMPPPVDRVKRQRNNEQTATSSTSNIKLIDFSSLLRLIDPLPRVPVPKGCVSDSLDTAPTVVIADADALLCALEQVAQRVGHVSRDGHEREVQAVLRVDWALLPESLFDAANAFLRALLAAQNGFADTALSNVLSMFRRYRTSADECQLHSGGVYSNNVHRLVDSICDTVPLKRAQLSQILAKLFPFRTRPAEEHSTFARNLLHFAELHPNLQAEVYQQILKQLVDIDLACPPYELKDGEEQLSANAERLNVTLDTLLRYLDNRLWSSGELERFFQLCMLPALDSLMLRSHGTSHTQFVWFLLANKETAVRDLIIEHLWARLTNPASSEVERLAAVNYLGSFIARAQSVDSDVCYQWLDRLVGFCSDYLTTYTSSSAELVDSRVIDELHEARPTAHRVFYACSQMSFYVSAFRSRELFADDSRRRRLEHSALRALVFSVLNPLRYCAPHIVDAFASVCEHYQLVFCHTLVTKNHKRDELQRYSKNTAPTLQQINPLHLFFPFEPFKLPLSRDLIEPHFRRYEPYASADATAVPVEDETPTDGAWDDDDSSDPIEGDGEEKGTADAATRRSLNLLGSLFADQPPLDDQDEVIFNSILRSSSSHYES